MDKTQYVTATLTRRGNEALTSSNGLPAPRKRSANKPLDQHPPVRPRASSHPDERLLVNAAVANTYRP